MFKFKVQLKGRDGIGDTSTQFYDLLLVPAENSGSTQLFCGSSSSYANAKTLANTIAEEDSLTWDDVKMETAAFTT